MIAFRHTDPRFPFLREHPPQPAGRWNTPDELTHYFCDTPDGAWAEFLRHEEIVDAEDIPTIRRALWAVEITDELATRPELPPGTLIGGPTTWDDCQREASLLRERGVLAIAAPSAALHSGGAHGWRVEGALKPGTARDGKVFALFGPQPNLVGWAATAIGHPKLELLSRVRHF